MVFNIQSLLLWGAVLATLFGCVVLYIFRGLRKDRLNEKILMMGFSSYLLGYFLFYFIMTFIWFTMLPGQYVVPTNTFFSDYVAFESEGGVIGNFLKASFISLLFGITGLIFAFEFNIRKTRYILTLANLILIAIFILISPSLTTYDEICLMPAMLGNINMYILIIIIIYFTKSAKPQLKAVSSLVCFGFFFLTYSFMFCAPEVMEHLKVHLTIPPITCIVGAVICISPTLMGEERIFKLSQNRTLWLVLGSFSLLVQGIFVVLALYYQISPNFWAGGILFGIFFIILLGRILKTTRIQKNIFKKQQSTRLLSAFTKPARITEEEISISKERQTCLVCKGKLTRLMFICPSCGAFYCIKCANSLVNIENACWVCENPIDETKPVTLQEQISSPEIDKSEVTGKKK